MCASVMMPCHGISRVPSVLASNNFAECVPLLCSGINLCFCPVISVWLTVPILACPWLTCSVCLLGRLICCTGLTRLRIHLSTLNNLLILSFHCFCPCVLIFKAFVTLVYKRAGYKRPFSMQSNSLALLSGKPFELTSAEPCLVPLPTACLASVDETPVASAPQYPAIRISSSTMKQRRYACLVPHLVFKYFFD